MNLKIEYLTPLIQVFTMSRSLKFYRDVLGFEVHMDSGDGDDSSWVWITKNGTHLMLNDQYEPSNVPPAPPEERVKWHKDTCLFMGCDDLDGAYEYLIAKGFDLKPPIVTSYGMKQLSLKDPDGYDLCFQHPA